MTQRLATRIQPSVWGIAAWACAVETAGVARKAPSAAPPTSQRAAAVVTSRHIDLHGVNHVPAVAERVERARGRLDAPETVRRARHERVRPGRRVPAVLPLPPRVAARCAGERLWLPCLTAVAGDVEPRE